MSSETRPCACLEPAEGALKELAKHAWDLGELVHGLAAQASPLREHAYAVGEWLTFAGGLKAVDIDTGRYDPTLFMCGAAADYEDARSDVVCHVQTELTRLLYVWSAYERLRRAAATTFGAVDEASDRQAREWLAREWTGPMPPHYLCAVAGMARLATSHPYYCDLARFVEPGPGYPLVVLGLRGGGQVRHWMAHGRVASPEPAQWGGQPRHDLLLVRGGCRLLLFSVQMLLAALVKDQRLTVELDAYDDDRSYEIPLEVAIVRVGVEPSTDGEE